MGKDCSSEFRADSQWRADSAADFHQRCGGGGCRRDGGEVPAARHLPDRWRDWFGAVPGGFGWHELEAGRHWRQRDMSELYPIIRRARRPLIISDDDSGPPPAPPPAVPVVQPEQPVSYAKSARRGKERMAALMPGSARLSLPGAAGRLGRWAVLHLQERRRKRFRHF